MGTNAVPELIELLGTEDPLMRRGFWAVRGKLPADVRRGLQTKVGTSEKGNLRGAAATCLGFIGPDAAPAVPALARALEDPDHQFCYEAAAAMGRIGKPSVPFLVNALDRADANRRRSFIAALSEIGPPAEAAVPALIGLLDDPDQTVRSVAGLALESIGVPWVTQLREVIAHGPSDGRAAAARELLLLNRGTIQAVKPLMEMAHAPQAGARRQAIEAMGILRPPHPAVIDVLRAALNDADAAVRLGAAQALGNLGQRAVPAIGDLSKAAEDKEEPVRLAAKEALAKIEQ
jgi:HEAT repeat protein